MNPAVKEISGPGIALNSFEPTVAVMYFGQKNGIEASLFGGLTINQKNPDTHYKSGSQFHIDGTLAQHFPFAGGVASAGVTGYYYRQVTW
ncbi:MAG: transporter [Gammaproteobacteria bacterium]|nr:transporter [Gammaproteobacteria bacterium]